MPTIQYSVGIDHLSVNKLFTSCIRRCLVSRVCDWVMSALSAVLLIFSFQFSLLFSHVDQPGIGRCRKFGSVSCTKRTVQENNFESRFHCKSFSPPPWSTLLCSNLVKLADGKSAKSCVIYRTKKNKISPACHTAAAARIARKICQGQPQQCTQSAPDFITIGSLSAEL